MGYSLLRDKQTFVMGHLVLRDSQIFVTGKIYTLVSRAKHIQYK